MSGQKWGENEVNATLKETGWEITCNYMDATLFTAELWNMSLLWVAGASKEIVPRMVRGHRNIGGVGHVQRY